MFISARSARDRAEKLAAEYGEPFDLVLREILAAVDRRDLSAHHPDDPAETWRSALPAMIDHIDRHQKGQADSDRALGPGILIFARWIAIDGDEMERWLATRGVVVQPASAEAAILKSGAPSKRRRSKPGPEPKLRTTIANRMLDDLRLERRTPEALRGDTLAALAQQYGGSPNTASTARRDALARFSKFQN